MDTLVCKGKQRKRKNVVITLDPELVEKARKLGLNISKVCENALIQAVKALEQVFDENKGGGGTVGFPLVRPPGFEPGLSAREADVLARLDYGR